MNETHRRYIIISISTILCIVINFGFNHLAVFILHVPLFLDTIGTVTVTFLFGWIPGLICALATTTIESIICDYFLQLPMLYVICSFSAVLICQIFKNFIFNTDIIIVRISYLFILSIAMCIIISVLGGIIDTICVTYSNYKSYYPVASDFFKPNFIKLGLSQLGTNIISRFPINIVDRLITSFIAYILAVCYKKISKQS
ncbi:MAG: hypothetical protein J5631_08800 [Spirochaetaceae bacterium]|nr:hypothetical protein [Spirochaetaceae bacterium]